MRPERSTGAIVPAAVLACGMVSALWPAQGVAADAAVSPWATGGAKVDAGSTDGKPVAGTALPIAQATPWPGYVIRGGTIPPGWQPQAVPYQAVGPDGRQVTILYAPTYTFTYQIGPPVPMLSPVNRPQAYPPPAPMPSTMAGPMQVNGWNYKTQGAAVPVPALAPTVARYQPAPFQYPTNAPQLAGQPLSPPASSPWQAAPVTPPSAWVPSSPPAPPPPALPPPPPPAASPPPVAFSSPPPVVPQAPPAATHMWRVVGVEDGDTLTCLDQTNQQQKVRLAEIDAPELGQDFGKVSREALAGMVFGKTVEVVDDGKDRYGRWLAHVLVNGEDVNRQMVATGNAWHYKAYSRDSSLAQLQSQARGQQIGLWAQPNPQPPWEFRATEKP